MKPLTGKTLKVEIEGKEITLTNLDKIFWPGQRYTKGDMVSFYFHISPYILPHLKCRPLSLKRYPNGLEGEHFFQKEAGPYVPMWLKTVPIFSDTKAEHINYILCNDLATLVYLANLACISQNPWLSRWPDFENPDFITFDLDPSEGAVFVDVQEVALLIKEILDDSGLNSFVKTTGATGMHIFVPVENNYTFRQIRDFAQGIAYIATKISPEKATLERSVAKREGKVYIDYLQNIEGKTLVSPYCLRARPGAPIATPLSWDELSEPINPEQFNIKTIFNRLSQTGDLWAEILTLRQRLDLRKAA